MADNIELNSGSGGATLAADDIGGVQYQRVKIAAGADGSATDVSDAAPLPVDDAGGSLTVDAATWPLPTGASTAANQTTIIGHLDGVEGLLTTIDGDTGNIATAASSIDGKITACNTGAVTVAGSALPTGAATESTLSTLNGKVTACNTGAVVVSSSALPSGAATAANQTTIIGHVDGIETVLGTMDADTSALAGCVGGTELQVDVVAGTVAATQSGAWNVTNISGTVSLPTGASTESTLSTLNGKVTACNTGAVVISSGAVTATCNAGTNLNTSALALETGGNLAGAATSLAVMDDWDNAASDGASVSGDVAHDTADAGEPVKIGCKATTSVSALTPVTDNDRTNLFAGVDGVLITRPHCNLEDIVTGNASNTDGTSTQCIAAAAAGIKQYLTSVILTNTSSSNIYVEIKDGSTVKVTIPLPANSGAIFNPPVPLPGSAATAWNFDPSGAATTVYCSMIGFKSKV